MRLLVAFAAGGLFGLGLVLSDMVNPARVLGFLDIAGAWDPTLAFVMAGALAPMAIAWRLAGRRSAPLCGSSFPAPPRRHIDTRLIGGSVLFGTGWGLVGFCPGPSLVVLGTGSWQALIFVVAMAAGMVGFAFAVPAPRGA